MPLFCVGMNQGSGTNAAGQVFPTATNAAVLAAVDAIAAGDPYTFKIDVSGWLNGTGTVAVQTNDGNSDYYIPSAATNHPNQAGHDYWSQRIANAIRSLLPSVR
jgi:hypothetical protein